MANSELFVHYTTLIAGVVSKMPMYLELSNFTEYTLLIVRTHHSPEVLKI